MSKPTSPESIPFTEITLRRSDIVTPVVGAEGAVQRAANRLAGLSSVPSYKRVSLAFQILADLADDKRAIFDGESSDNGN